MTTSGVFKIHGKSFAKSTITGAYCVRRDPCRGRQRLLRGHCTYNYSITFRVPPCAPPCTGHAVYRLLPPCFPAVMRHTQLQGKFNFSVQEKSKVLSYIFTDQIYVSTWQYLKSALDCLLLARFTFMFSKSATAERYAASVRT